MDRKTADWIAARLAEGREVTHLAGPVDRWVAHLPGQRDRIIAEHRAALARMQAQRRQVEDMAGWVGEGASPGTG